MASCISPADNNYDETLSTLRYANRAKNIKNKPKINEDPKDALLRQYQSEIDVLKKMLMGQIEISPDLLGELRVTRDLTRFYEKSFEILRHRKLCYPLIECVTHFL